MSNDVRGTPSNKVVNFIVGDTAVLDLFRHDGSKDSPRIDNASTCDFFPFPSLSSDYVWSVCHVGLRLSQLIITSFQILLVRRLRKR